MDFNCNKTLYFFTASFPYGIKSETFIETEIKYHASLFKKVYVIPLYKESEYLRELPANVELLSFLANSSFSKRDKIKAALENPFLLFRIVVSEMRGKGLFTYLSNLKFFLDILFIQFCVAKKIKENLLNNLSPNYVFYDFWFEDSTLALSILKSKNLITNFFTKAHGFDVYDERWGNIGIPYRNWKMKYITGLYVVSDFGIKYVKSKIKSEYHKKIGLARYGVNRFAVNKDNKPGEHKVIVSCARLVDFKRIDFIPGLLKDIDQPIHWIHFGDGDDRKKVEAACENLPAHIKCTLMGQVDNKDVVNYYINNHVDLLLSLSTTEGLPVSMIEALSFNIPIVAYPAGGVPELVIDGVTGFILNKPEDIATSSQLIKKALNYPFDKNKIAEFFDKNINADVNYPNFIKEICGRAK